MRAGIIASAYRPAASGGSTDLGAFTSGDTITPASGGGLLVFIFWRITTSNVGSTITPTYAGSATTARVVGTGSRTCLHIHTAPPGTGGVVSWPEAYNLRVYQVSGSTVTAAAAIPNADGMGAWSATLTGSQPGDAVVASYVAYLATSYTVAAPLSADASPNAGALFASGVAGSADQVVSGTQTPVQTNAAYRAAGAIAIGA